MTREEIIEATALVLFNRMRTRRKMHTVGNIGANNTPECNECRAEADAALSVLCDAIPGLSGLIAAIPCAQQRPMWYRDIYNRRRDDENRERHEASIERSIIRDQADRVVKGPEKLQ
jgi:hypothetical protein